jgi:hypothetical protein
LLKLGSENLVVRIKFMMTMCGADRLDVGGGGERGGMGFKSEVFPQGKMIIEFRQDFRALPALSFYYPTQTTPFFKINFIV